MFGTVDSALQKLLMGVIEPATQVYLGRAFFISQSDGTSFSKRKPMCPSVRLPLKNYMLLPEKNTTKVRSIIWTEELKIMLRF